MLWVDEGYWLDAKITSCGPGEDCLDIPVYGSGLQYYETERVVGLKLRENAAYMGDFGDIAVK